MDGKFGGLPIRHGAMAFQTHIINSGCEMVGIGGRIVIRLMAGETIGRYIGIIARNMALIAIIDGMTLGQRKARMIKSCRGPARHGAMAFQTHIINSGREMVGIGGRIIVRLMA